MEMERGHITQSENGILTVNNTKTKAIDLRPYVFSMFYYGLQLLLQPQNYIMWSLSYDISLHRGLVDRALDL